MTRAGLVFLERRNDEDSSQWLDGSGDARLGGLRRRKARRTGCNNRQDGEQTGLGQAEQTFTLDVPNLATKLKQGEQKKLRSESPAERTSMKTSR